MHVWLIKDRGIGFEINKLQIFAFFYIKMNRFEAHLMGSSRVVDSKVLRMVIQFEYFSDTGAKWLM